ncbi:hypothetical protein L3V82_12075 [Thiotrichales bacterium 19S3-7]|nr:hypothetical protein [Thiotrichales bacterium 19S3-7]MCF6802931.1 hypothetical protein [Thiotrichales bacterium 19S3-11]
MKKVTKRILLIIISVVVGLILLAFIAFGILNYYRFSPLTGYISTQASQALGQKVVLDGIHVGYSFDDGLSVSIEGLSLTQKGNDKQAEHLLADVQSAKISFSLLPIFSGSFKLNSLTVTKAVINYDATNPLIIASSEAQQAETKETTKETPQPKEKEHKPSEEAQKQKPNFLWLNLLPKIVITDSSITYKNQQATYHLQIIKQTLINTTNKANKFDTQLEGDWLFNHIGIAINGRITSTDLKQNANLNLTIKDASNNQLSVNSRLSYNQENEFIYQLNTNGALTNLKQWQTALGTEYQQINELNQLNWQGNFSYDKTTALKSELTLSSKYNNLDYKVLLNAHSLDNNPSIFPLSFTLKAIDNESNLDLSVDGYINDNKKSQWLKADVLGQLKDPKKLFINDQLPFNQLALNATIIGDNNQLSVNDAEFKAIYQKKLFSLKFNYQLIKSDNHFPMQFSFDSSYNNHSIFQLNGKGQWPIDTNNWLNAKLNLNADHIQQLLKDLNISTGNYQVQSVDALINLNGEKPNQLIADIKPTTIKVNQVEALFTGQLTSVLNKENPALNYNLKVQVNHNDKDQSANTAETNYITLKGFVSNYQQSSNQPWFDLIVNGHIDKLAIIQPLVFYQLPQLTDLNIAFAAHSSGDQLKVTIDTMSAKYLDQLLSLKGHGAYGIYQTNRPINGGLFLTYLADSIQLNVSGFWEENQGVNFNLLATIANLSKYGALVNIKLPEVTNINLRSQLSVFPHQLVLNNLSLQAGANQNPSSIQLQGKYNFNNQLFKVLISELDLNGLTITGNASGQLSDDNRHYQGTLNVSARSLSGFNQLLYRWFNFYLPQLENVKLSTDFKERNHQLNVVLNAQSDSGDLSGNIQWKVDQLKHQLLAKLNSQSINLYAIEQAMHTARTTLKITSDSLSLTDTSVHPTNEEKHKQAEAVKAQKVKWPQWMNKPLSDLLETYQSDISYQIKKLILARDEKSENILLKAQTSPEGALFSLTVDTLFSGNVNLVGNLKPDRNAKGNYQLDLNGYIGILNITPENLLLDDYLPLDKGSLMTQIEATSDGKTTTDIISKLKGKMKIAGDSLTIKLFNSKSVLGKFLLLLSGDKFSKDVTVPCAYTVFDIDQGVLTIQDLLVNSKGAIVTGKGSIDLVNQRIDITLTPKAKFINLASIALPITLSGTFSKLYIYPETTGSVIKTGAAAALLATGIGAVGLVATEATTGTYRAYKDYCSGVLDKF